MASRKTDSGQIRAPSAWTCIGRALKLRCPECGVWPIFTPVRRVRGLFDWFTPLDGCPRCGYAYERESGYFLLAVWGINYGVVAGLGLIVTLLLDHYLRWPLLPLLLIVGIPMPILSFLLARHAKALYLAMDHYFDPHLGKDHKLKGRQGERDAEIDC